MARELARIHPGAVLFEEFQKGLSVNQYRLTRDVSVPPRRINEIVHGKRGITANATLRLSRYFGMSERFCSTCKQDLTWRSRRTGLATD